MTYNFGARLIASSVSTSWQALYTSLIDGSLSVFQSMVGDQMVFREERTDTTEDYSWEISFFSSWCRRLAGDIDGAISALERSEWGGPPIQGSGWWIAKWCSEQGEFEKAAAYLKREHSVSGLSPLESWQLSTILAINAMAAEGNAAATFSKTLEKKNANLYLVMSGLIYEHWPAFALLQEESRSRWLFASAQVHADILGPEFRAACLNSAIREFGWVLERELKIHVFDEFRSGGTYSRDYRTKLDFSHDSHNLFFRFLVRKPEITLGAMILTLEHSKVSERYTDLRFREWLRQKYPKIGVGIHSMKRVLEARNAATHKNAVFDLENVLRVSQECRKALSAFL